MATLYRDEKRGERGGQKWEEGGKGIGVGGM